MFNFTAIAWLFPIVFMLHEFEEIIFFKPWIQKNGDYLQKQLPKSVKHFVSHLEKLSVSAFNLAVAEEFILLSIITIVSVMVDSYLLWLGVFMGFFIHLLVHLAQWIILRRYIPTIITAFISLIYCGFTLTYILNILWIYAYIYPARRNISDNRNSALDSNRIYNNSNKPFARTQIGSMV